MVRAPGYEGRLTSRVKTASSRAVEMVLSRQISKGRCGWQLSFGLEQCPRGIAMSMPTAGTHVGVGRVVWDEQGGAEGGRPRADSEEAGPGTHRDGKKAIERLVPDLGS